jgi:cytoskeletal protein RodZ
MTPDQLVLVYQWLSSAGFPGTLALLLWLSIKGRIRWEREAEQQEKDYQELKADRDEWKARALRYMDRLDSAKDVAETAATVAVHAAGRRGSRA